MGELSEECVEHSGIGDGVFRKEKEELGGDRRRRRRGRRTGNGRRSIAFEEERKLERGVVCEPDIGLEETGEENLEKGRRRKRIRGG